MSGGKSAGAGKSLIPELSKSAAGVGGVAGGSRVTHITLRVDTLVRTLNVSAANITESAKEAAKIVTEILMAELNDVNTMTS